MNLLHSKKFKHGSVSLALTACIIAAVILLNVIFSAVVEKYLLYIDMTVEPRFTLSDEAREYLAEMDTTKEVNVMFCDDEDMWKADTIQYEVLTTVNEIALDFPNVKTSFIDIYTNPSAVNAYKDRTGKNITSSSVIITSGSELRVYNIEEFFTIDSSTNYVTGYDGEQVLVSALRSVTRANAPVLGVVNNHGETYSDTLISSLAQIGFDVQYLNLLTDPIPADCRLLLISDPRTDYAEIVPGISDISEIDKIEQYLAGHNSMMVLFDIDTPVLPNLEQLMAEWGIEIARTDNNENYVIKESGSHALAMSSGFSNIAVYETGGTGADITTHMRNESNPKTVVFPNATALRFSSLYQNTLFQESADSDSYRVASYTNNAKNRACYNVFLSSPNATAWAGSQQVAAASDADPFSYMMLSVDTVMDNTTNTKYHSFVLAASSTAFASDAALNTAYGNRSVISYACNTMGSLVVPVSLDCKYYVSMDIASITSAASTAYTVIFAAVPTLAVFIAGIYVMVRRKYA